MAAIAETKTSPAPEPAIGRFDIHQRIQHFLMMSTFILLAFTGLPLKFHDWPLSQWWIGVWGGIESTRNVHHLAAWVMVFDCVYHGLYLVYTIFILKRPFPSEMIASPKDVLDLYQDLLYYLGRSPHRARYGRFSYREKFDYWAIFWGMPIMAGSGFILMYPVFVTQYLPGWTVPVALIAHSDEAILAVGWIMTVHIFFSHLTPRFFPLDKTIFTGTMSHQHYREEHPLEYAKITAAREEELATEKPGEATKLSPHPSEGNAPTDSSPESPPRGSSTA